jgi:hypothetical protein
MIDVRQRSDHLAKKSCGLMLLSALALAFPVGAFADEEPDVTSNEHLLNAMPDGVTSVVIWRYNDIRQHNELLRDDMNRTHQGLGDPRGEWHDHSLDEMIQIATYAAKPIVSIRGGSDFISPEGIGAAVYNQRGIWIVDQPLDVLREQIQRRLDAGMMERDGEVADAIYRGTIMVRQSRAFWEEPAEPDEQQIFVTMPDDRTVLLAQSRDEIEQMRQRFAGRAEGNLTMWRRIAGDLPIDATVVVLRKFDPTNERDEFSPANPLYREERGVTRAENVALVLPDPTSADFVMRYVGDGIEEVAKLYQRYWSGHDWTVTEKDDGFLSQLAFKGEPEASGVDSFTVVLFPVLYTFGLSALF